MTGSVWLALFGGVAVFNAVFIGVLMFVNHHSLLKNKLLGLFFLSLSVRIGKSLLIVLFPSVPDSIVGVGLLGMVMTGPLIYFYIRSLSTESFELQSKHFVHLIAFSLTGLLLFTNSDTVVRGLYIAASIQLLAYVVASFTLRRSVKEVEHQRWTTDLLLGITAIWIVYTSQIFVESHTAYLIGTMTATLVLYAFLYGAFRNHRVFLQMKKAPIRSERTDGLAARLIDLMEQERIYRETDLTLSKVADRVKVKPYLVSHALNASMKKTFPEFVNYYRIKEAERMLVSRQYQAYTMEAIAFDCGFSTPSAFYSLFKKVKKQTPSEFRNRNLVERVG